MLCFTIMQIQIPQKPLSFQYFCFNKKNNEYAKKNLEFKTEKSEGYDGGIRIITRSTTTRVGSEW